MRRLKILVVPTLSILSFLALGIIVTKTVSTPETDMAISTTPPVQTLISETEAQLYNEHKQELKDAIKAYFEKAIASGDIVGAGVSIVMQDSIVISDGYGKRNINLNDGVDGETVFRLGSLSKGFAGILAANLKHEGKLDWKDKVSDYLPEFQLGDRNNTDKITLANILSHTSGTPYHSYTNLVEAGLSMKEIAGRFKSVKPISQPGLLYSYQNAMFALCGEIMYKATGQDISASLKNTFFKPLGMCSTTMDYETLEHTENVALPHSQRRNIWKTLRLNDHYYNAIAAGGINANAHDMGRWMRFLLGHNPELMDKSALSEAFNPFVEIKGHSKYYQRWPGHLTSYYGFGWRIHKYREADSSQEKTIWHHGGSVNNYRNEIAVFPEADLGICVLLNSNSKLAKIVIPDLHKIVKEVYEKNTPKLALNNGTETIPHL